MFVVASFFAYLEYGFGLFASVVWSDPPVFRLGATHPFHPFVSKQWSTNVSQMSRGGNRNKPLVAGPPQHSCLDGCRVQIPIRHLDRAIPAELATWVDGGCGPRRFRSRRSHIFHPPADILKSVLSGRERRATRRDL